jgi:hypothetical protein
MKITIQKIDGILINPSTAIPAKAEMTADDFLQIHQYLKFAEKRGGDRP